MFCHNGRGANAVAQIVRVIDGDRFLVYCYGAEQQVRAIGIDAPEASERALDLRRGNKTFGQAATEPEMGRLSKDHAAQLLPAGETVVLVLDPANETTNHKDRYGRLLAFVYLADKDGSLGEFINLRMVTDGYAEALMRYPYDVGIKHDLVAAQEETRRLRSGIWDLYPDVFN